MAATRLDNDERRAAIIAAAVPLFARKGFSGTTTREIAEAANVSEALLFKHFPSKKRLYGEILRLGCEGDPALERLADLEPSTRTLVRMVHFMTRHFLLAAGGERADLDARLRLLLTAISRTANTPASCSSGSSSGCIRCLPPRWRRRSPPAICSRLRSPRQISSGSPSMWSR